MIAILKFFHIAALCVWCAGLVGLPLLLARHDPHDAQTDFTRLRLLTHHAYVGIVTPAAVIAIALGTALIFLRDMFVPWLFVKLVLVGVLVLVHAWLGHVTLKVGEHQGRYDSPSAIPFVGISVVAMLAILFLVLGKPFVGEGLAPVWLVRPQGQPLPVGEVPI
jgi:uncharacterized membrane protein